MADRYERIEIFNESMKLCEKDEFLSRSVRSSIADQKIYWESDAVSPLIEKRFASTEFLVNSKRSCEAAKDFSGKSVCVLNFASSFNPGGGVKKGAGAQEESICRISTLYKSLADKSVKEFYDSHSHMIRRGKNDRRNNDDIIYTPGVTVFREDTFDCELMPQTDWYNVDVITCAAPDLRLFFDRSDYTPGDDELRELHLKRWKRILTVASLYKEEVLILGAFGCGVFNNPPEIVAGAARQVCNEFDGVFEKIVFAVFTNDHESENYRAFSEAFGSGN